jgi:hypothetical protein
MTDDDTPNPFEALGEKQIPNPVKSRMRGVETRRQKALQKALHERDYLFREWKKWHDDRKKELLKGDYAVATQELVDFLERMTLNDSAILLELVMQGPWRNADSDTRFLVLELVSLSIIYLREKNKLPPFDDPMPFSEVEEPPTVFQIVHGALT